MRVIYAGDGMYNPARGVRGGGSGSAFRAYRRGHNGALEDAPDCADLDLASGETIIGISCGGGGYGSALERDSERVRHDVAEGYVSRERAAAVYGVMVDSDGEVDLAATASFRAEGRKS